jgi:hypothetical protein
VVSALFTVPDKRKKAQFSSFCLSGEGRKHAWLLLLKVVTVSGGRNEDFLTQGYGTKDG